MDDEPGRWVDEPPLPTLTDPPPHLILVRGAQLVRVHNVDDPDPRRRKGFTQVVIIAWAPLPDGGWAGLCVWLSGWHAPGPRGSRVTGRGRYAWCRILTDRVEAWRPPRPYIQDPDQGWHGQGDPSEITDAMARAAETLPEPKRARLFTLERNTDVSGISGTGTVADGVAWPDGTVTIRWRGERPSTVNWGRIEDAAAVHGHGGATRIAFADESWPRDKPMPAFVWGDRGAHYRQAVLEYWEAHGVTPRNHADPTTVSNAVEWWNGRATAERERLVHDNPELAAQVREGIAEAERGETVDLGSFARYLNEGDDDDCIAPLLDQVEREPAWIWPKGYRQPRRSRLISRRPEIYRADPLRRLPFWRRWNNA